MASNKISVIIFSSLLLVNTVLSMPAVKTQSVSSTSEFSSTNALIATSSALSAAERTLTSLLQNIIEAIIQLKLLSKPALNNDVKTEIKPNNDLTKTTSDLSNDINSTTNLKQRSVKKGNLYSNKGHGILTPAVKVTSMFANGVDELVDGADKGIEVVSDIIKTTTNGVGNVLGKGMNIIGVKASPGSKQSINELANDCGRKKT